MSKEITRFCPTIFNGQLHVGHIYNYIANLFYAKKYDGHCYFAPEGAFFLGPNRLVKQTSDNMKIAENFCISTGRNVCLPLVYNLLNHSSAQTPYLKYILKDLEAIPDSDDRNDHFGNGESCEVAVNDFIIGTTTIIRGRDLSAKHQKNIHSVFQQSKHEMWLDYLNKKSGNGINVKIYFHPLLTYYNNKISKSNGKEIVDRHILKDIIIKTYSFSHTRGCWSGDITILEDNEEIEKDKTEVMDYLNDKSEKVMPSSVILYVMELMNKKQFDCTSSIYEFYKNFDIEEICSQDNYEYKIEDLLFADSRLRDMLCKEKGINRNDVLLINAERDFMHHVVGFLDNGGRLEESGSF